MFKNINIFFSSDVPVWILLRLGLLFDLKHAGFGLKKQAPTKSTHVKSTELYCRWQNGKQYKGKANSQQSALARRVRQGCTGRPPPSLHWVHSHIGWLRNSIVKISLNTKLWQNYLNITKLEENYAKHEIKNFAATLLLHNLPSAKRFFIEARQCYLEMRMIQQPYFSILSSIILWLNQSLKKIHSSKYRPSYVYHFSTAI